MSNHHFQKWRHFDKKVLTISLVLSNIIQTSYICQTISSTKVILQNIGGLIHEIRGQACHSMLVNCAAAAAATATGDGCSFIIIAIVYSIHYYCVRIESFSCTIHTQIQIFGAQNTVQANIPHVFSCNIKMYCHPLFTFIIHKFL